MAEQTSIQRLESFPFDSKADGYDADGYPVYDRAVGALMLRATFGKFFTDGIFPSPGTALHIGKGDSGLTVTVQPGIGIIRGAMGGVTGDDPATLTLDTAAPQGNVAYGVMLRYDENDTEGTGRSLSLRVVRGDPAATPEPPAPDQSTPGVMEYRLGHVTVSSGATDLAGATVSNEKGTAVCPYAAPFVEIDVSEIATDCRLAATEALSALMAYFETDRDAIDAALSDEEATYLQQQITAIQQQIDAFGIDLAEEVDGVTIEYATGGESMADTDPKLRVKDGGLPPSAINSPDAWRQAIYDPPDPDELIEYLEL